MVENFGRADGGHSGGRERERDRQRERERDRQGEGVMRSLGTFYKGILVIKKL